MKVNQNQKFGSFSANFRFRAEGKKVTSRAENSSARAMARASSAQTHHYYIYYSSIYVKYIGTLLWYAKYYEMTKTLKVKSPCVVCYKLNKNPAISFLLSNNQHVVLSVYLKTKFNGNKQYIITL